MSPGVQVADIEREKKTIFMSDSNRMFEYRIQNQMLKNKTLLICTYTCELLTHQHTGDSDLYDVFEVLQQNIESGNLKIPHMDRGRGERVE